MSELNSLRILSKGKITDLSSGFDLGGTPFSIFVRSKSGTFDTHVVVKCQLICDREAGDFPVPLGDWSPGAIQKIPKDGIDLDAYEVFWGAGETIKNK